MDITDIKSRLIEHIGNIDLEKLSLSELREYCGLVKDAEGLTNSNTDMIKTIMDKYCAGFGLGYNRPAPVKEG